MLAYEDLSDSAKRVLRLTVVYPHLSSCISGVMMKDNWAPETQKNYQAFLKGRKELESAGLIKLKKSKDGHERILTALGYRIFPKEVLVDLLIETREAFNNQIKETSQGQGEADKLNEIREILLRVEKNMAE